MVAPLVIKTPLITGTSYVSPLLTVAVMVAVLPATPSMDITTNDLRCPPPRLINDGTLLNTAESDTQCIISLPLPDTRLRADDGPVVPRPPRARIVIMVDPVIGALVRTELLIIAESQVTPLLSVFPPAFDIVTSTLCSALVVVDNDPILPITADSDTHTDAPLPLPPTRARLVDPAGPAPLPTIVML